MNETRFQMGDRVWLKCSWNQPAWCREEWVRVTLPNTHQFYVPLVFAEIDGADAWIRAIVTKYVIHYETPTYVYHLRAIDCDGEGSLDGFNAAFIKPRKVDTP